MAGSALLSLLLAACGTLPQLDRDGAPLLRRRPAPGPNQSIQPAPAPAGNYRDAEPRFEPRSRLGNPPFYVVNGRRYVVLDTAHGFRERGIASWYGPDFHGKKASNGEDYDMHSMTAAHKTLPLPSFVRVTNLENGRSAIVRVNDRGPFVDNRIIDLSFAAATRLGVVQKGTAPVEIAVVEPGDAGVQVADPGPRPVLGKPRLYLQTGAFAQRENAERMRQRLLLAQMGPVDIRTEPAGARPMHKVWVGPFAEVADLDAASVRLHGLGINDPRPTID